MIPQAKNNAPLEVEQEATIELPFNRAQVVMIMAVIGLIVAVFMPSPPTPKPEDGQQLALAATKSEPTSHEAAEVADTTIITVNEEPLLITSAGQVQRLDPASLTRGHSIVGLYKMQLLPNGEVAIKLKSNGCNLSSDAANEEIEATTRTVNPEPLLIVSAGHVPRIGSALFTQGYPTVGLYKMQPLPNGKIAIKLKSDSLTGC